jgi:hypothetical protein
MLLAGQVESGDFTQEYVKRGTPVTSNVLGVTQCFSGLWVSCTTQVGTDVYSCSSTLFQTESTSVVCREAARDQDMVVERESGTGEQDCATKSEISYSARGC